MNIYKSKTRIDLFQHVVNNINDTIYIEGKTRDDLFNLKGKDIRFYYNKMLEKGQKGLKFKDELKIGDAVRLSLKNLICKK